MLLWAFLCPQKRESLFGLFSLLRPGSGGRRETQAVDEVEENLMLRRTTRKRTASTRRQKPQQDTCKFI